MSRNRERCKASEITGTTNAVKTNTESSSAPNGAPSSDKEEKRRAESALMEELKQRMQGRKSSTRRSAPVRKPRASTSSLKEMSDSELAVRGAKGCEKSWSTLYHRSYPFLLGYAYSLGWGGDEAEDFVQETLVRAWENRADYNPAYSFANWVRTILHRLSTDQKRRRGSWEGICQKSIANVEDCSWRGASFGDTEKEVEQSAIARHLQPVLSEMREEDRDLLLRVAEGEKVADMARAEGVNATTLRGRTFRARTRFLEIYEARYGALGEVPEF